MNEERDQYRQKREWERKKTVQEKIDIRDRKREYLSLFLCIDWYIGNLLGKRRRKINSDEKERGRERNRQGRMREKERVKKEKKLKSKQILKREKEKV